MQDLEVVIGLEIHVELLTESKLFCHCPAEFSPEPNTHTCPICLGHPGVLPVLNQKAVEYSVKAGLALNCRIPATSKFDRKHYFYPDMAKNYQISQYDQPLCVDGHVDFDLHGVRKRVRIKRAHLEEDTGKLLHEGEITGSPASLVDFNRAGVPLLEIVTEPDINSPGEARAFLTKLRTILQYTGVSDCKMEEGSLRCDANISLRPRGQVEFGTKTEIKNMNSFRSVERALAFEVQRQAQLLEKGEQVIQETRHWDEQLGETRSMRSKEEAHDYRYFPEPDLVPVEMSAEGVEKIRDSLPELPDARQERFTRVLGLPKAEAQLLVAHKDAADYFEEVLPYYNDSKTVANWVTGELTGALNRKGLDITQCPVAPEKLGRLLALLDRGTISSKMAKDLFTEVLETGRDPETIVAEKNLSQITDPQVLEEVVERVLAANPDSVAAYRGGKDRALGFLVGQIMKETKGRANPQLVNGLLKEKLNNS